MSRLRTLLLVSGMLAMGLLEAPAGAERTAEPLSDTIQRERQALEKLKGRLEEQKRQVQETERKRESVLQSLQTLDGKLIVGRQQRFSIERELKRKDRDLESITGQLEEVRVRIHSRRSAILARLRVQYIEGRFGYLKALLAAESAADLQRRFQYLSAISKREYDLIEAHKQDLTRLQEIERRRTEARDSMLALKRQTDVKLREINTLKKDKRKFLARITRQKEAYEEAIAEYQREAARVDALLRELEERRRATAPSIPPRGQGYLGFKGTLPWPAEGEVVSFFGRQKHPNFDTYIQRKGIEIRTLEGSGIRAVMAGVVAYADWLKGYGLVLIVDHRNGLFSLYAHASKILTKVGEKVQAGQLIGETGDTGLTGEYTLYFELRDGAEPVDPLHWLAKRP